ncbi:hypothetical protein MSAN_00273400 [Mycena sanguinolenta]|uniref:Uncharacterized protein n=1 Tax=Mycena sanguinolenta TaxID=230812 RepID=A0A8H7DN44_9AGAR|nr:hypothetical protein MSAN_00273400 [Mycena sanguinolenta]
MLSLRRLFLLASLLSGVHCAMDDTRRSAALLAPISVPKEQRAQPREKLIRGLLRSRQDVTCDNPGYGVCPDLSGCCPDGWECCFDWDGCCSPGSSCGTTSCLVKKKTPVGAIAGGSVGGVVVLALGVFAFFRRRRNRTQPLPARDAGVLVAPTSAVEKHGAESLYSSSPGQAVVSALPTSAVLMPPKPAGGYSHHEVHAAPSYPTTISPMVPPNLQESYSGPQRVYVAPPAPTTISSTGGTISTKS